VWILDLDSLVPFLGNALKMLRRKILMRLDPIIMVDHIFVFIRIVRFIIFMSLAYSDILGFARIPRWIASMAFFRIFPIKLLLFRCELV
jgi:hypothetical protein